MYGRVLKISIMSKKLHVNAHIAYEIRGVKSYKSFSYQVDHWENAMAMLFATADWPATRELLFHNRTEKGSGIVGITFNFKDDAPFTDR